MKDDQQSRILRGKRLKELKKITGLTAVAIAELTGLSKSAISYWENGARGGLTRKAAEKIIDSIEKIGVKCDFDWLWFGENKLNNIVSMSNNNQFLIDNSGKLSVESLNKEMEVFSTLNKNAIIVKIDDELMLPFLKISDVIGGLWQNSETLFQKNVLNEIFIIKINDEYKVRNLNVQDKKITISHCNKNMREQTTKKKDKIEIGASMARVWRYF